MRLIQQNISRVFEKKEASIHFKYGMISLLAWFLSASASLAAENVFSVGDFGAVGNGIVDDREAIQAAIDAAIASGKPAVVRFGTNGTYRLEPSTESVASLLVSNARWLSLEGNGSMLLTHPSNRTLSIFNSKNIRMVGFRIDYNPLPYTQGRIDSIEPEAVVFMIDEGYPLPRIGGGEVYPNHPNSDCVFLNGKTRQFNHAWQRMSGVEQVDEYRFRVRFYPGAHPRQSLVKPGDFIAVKIPYELPPFPRTADGRFVAAGAGNIRIGFSERVVLTDIESYAAPSMTLVAHGSEDIQASGLRIIRKPGTDRLIASCSDGAHMKSLTIMPRFKDCQFEAIMDDSINIKVSAQRILKIQGKRILMEHTDILWNDIVLKPGDKLEFVNAAETAFIGLAKVMAVERVAYQQAWVTFNRSPGDLERGDLAFLRPQTTAVVGNCTFRSQLKTAVVTRPQTQIENCTFEGLAYGVHAMLWGGIEGPAPRGIDIRNCTFEKLWVAAVQVDMNTFAVVPPGLPGLVVENCQMELGSRAIAIGGRIPELSADHVQIKTGGSHSKKRLFPIQTQKRSITNISIE